MPPLRSPLPVTQISEGFNWATLTSKEIMATTMSPRCASIGLAGGHSYILPDGTNLRARDCSDPTLPKGSRVARKFAFPQAECSKSRRYKVSLPMALHLSASNSCTPASSFKGCRASTVRFPVRYLSTKGLPLKPSARQGVLTHGGTPYIGANSDSALVPGTLPRHIR